MKYLFIETVFDSPHLETSAEIALDLKNQRKSVNFSWIGYNLPWSDWSISKNKIILGASQLKKVNLIETILKKNNIECETPIKINKKKLLKINSWAKKFNGNLEKLKKYKYKNINLGIGVASSLISYYHQSNLDTKKYHEVVVRALTSSAIIYERSLLLISKTKPKIVVTFNNRFASSLPIVLAAKRKKIRILRHERGSNYNKYEIFKKDVHDLSYRSKNIKDYWLKEKNLKIKTKIAKKYFLNRRNGIPLGWDMKKNFTLKQKSGKIIPKDKNFTRIVFFTASEDEHESTKFQLKNLIWSTQELALKNLIKSLKILKKFELFIRVHPTHGKRKSYVDQEKWIKFNNNKNINVIPADSSVNSYELLDTADLVVTYGGNIGIEAVFWKKKVMTLRNSIYSGHGIAYEPKNFKNIKSIIKNFKKYKIINPNRALPFAYYFMTFGKKFKFFKCKDFDECYYKNLPISHLNSLLYVVKRIKKKLSR